MTDIGSGYCEDLCGRKVGEFVLRERIGTGGFGAVYRCEQPLLGREAVVKVLHPRLRHNEVVLQRFMREAQLASRLDHPYAAHVYAFGIERDDGLFWIAMEMVQGPSLFRWLAERGPLSLDQLVPFFERVAEVVQTAHDRGIVHRDLKPSNIMVIERAGRLLPKLLDFGIAKLLDDADAMLPMVPESALPSAAAMTPAAVQRSHPPIKSDLTPTASSTPLSELAPGYRQRLTRPSAALGSPPYMAPEQWSNAVTVGPSVDIYALGVIAYEALTGRRPFHAVAQAQFAELHKHAPVPPLGAGFAPVLDRMFQRALAKRPEERWESALELAAALRTASGLGGVAVDLPRLDEAIRDAWLTGAPQPLAESIAALDAARNAHQARDAAQALVHHLVRYLLALGLATRAQVQAERSDPELVEVVRAMRQRDLRDDERVRLLRLLVRPLASRRGAHPIPELVDLVTPRADDGADGLDGLLALHATSDHAGDDHAVRTQLVRLIPELTHLLRKLGFALDYILVVARGGAAERWTGLRRPHRAVAEVRAGEIVEGHPMLVDPGGRICVDLWPLVQAVPPSEGAEPELFLFDGRGRHGARMIAGPAGFEHHDPAVWDWIARDVIAEGEAAPQVGPDERAPYLGLTPFSTSDARRFVGREREVDALLNRLRQRALQIVVGASGAGKSSFVHAGVLAALPAGWRTITLRPGSAPLAALASRLTAAGVAPADRQPVLEATPDAVAAMVAHAAGPGTVVIVIDQLEELFTLCTSGEERMRFATVLAQLAASADAPIRVICTIRDDFLMQLEALAPLRPLLSPALVLLGNPSREALVRIVVEPARRAGYALSDPELAQDIVNAVPDRPGALALLSFTASRLWELRDRRFRQLTRSAYDAMGGVGGALGQHAEATFEGLPPGEQRPVRELFRHLVTAEGTRATLTARELRRRLATPRADEVLDKLVGARLIAVSESEGESQVEIIHEALIGAWPRLQQWMREDADGARMRDQVRTAARRWHEGGRRRGLLWRDDALTDLERWLRRGGPAALGELETAFVEASRRRARRARRWLIGSVALALAIAFGAFQVRALRARVAQEVAEAHVTRAYAEQGRHAVLEGKYTEALIYLLQARRRGDDSPATAFMLARAAQPLLAQRARLVASTARLWAARYSPDRQRIVTSHGETARLWDARTYQLVATMPHDGLVYDAVFDRHGSKMVTASADGSINVWNAGTGERVFALTSSGQSRSRYWHAAFSPDGLFIAAIGDSGPPTHVWDARTGDFIAELITTAGTASTSLAFSHDGRWLASGGGDDVRVFETRTWQPVLRIAGPQITQLSFDPTGPRLATASWLGDASIWEVPSGARVHRLRESGTQVTHAAYSPDGAFVVITSRDGVERVWNAATGVLQLELKTRRGVTSWAEFDSTSRFVVSAGTDPAVVVSNVIAGVPVSVLDGPLGRIGRAHFEPGGDRVIGASWDGSAWIWDPTPPYHRWSSPPVHDACINIVNAIEDRRFVAVDCGLHGTRIWDTARDQLLAELPGVEPAAEDPAPAFPAVSAAGDRAAMAIGNTVAVYALPGGALVRTITHPTTVRAIAFARTGRDMVSGGLDGSLLLTRDDQDAVALPAFPVEVDALGVTSDRRVIVAGALGHLHIYDPDRSEVMAKLVAPSQARVRAFRLSGDDRRLITIPRNITAEPPVLWDLEGRRVVAQLEGHTGQVYAARFAAGDGDIVTAASDGSVKRWDSATGRLRQTYLGNDDYLTEAAIDPEGSIVVAGGGDGVLRFWDRASGRMLWTMRAHRFGVSSIHFEGTDLVTHGHTGELSRWSVPRRPSSQDLDRLEEIARCLPLRLDEKTGSLIQQQPCRTP